MFDIYPGANSTNQETAINAEKKTSKKQNSKLLWLFIFNQDILTIYIFIAYATIIVNLSKHCTFCFYDYNLQHRQTQITQIYYIFVFFLSLMSSHCIVVECDWTSSYSYTAWINFHIFIFFFFWIIVVKCLNICCILYVLHYYSYASYIYFFVFTGVLKTTNGWFAILQKKKLYQKPSTI